LRGVVLRRLRPNIPERDPMSVRRDLSALRSERRRRQSAGHLHLRVIANPPRPGAQSLQTTQPAVQSSSGPAKAPSQRALGSKKPSSGGPAKPSEGISGAAGSRLAGSGPAQLSSPTSSSGERAGSASQASSSKPASSSGSSSSAGAWATNATPSSSKRVS